MTTPLPDVNAPTKSARFRFSPINKFGLSDQLKILSKVREAAYKGNWTELRSLGFDCLGKAYAGVQALRIENNQFVSKQSEKIESNVVYMALQRLVENNKYDDLVDRFRKRWATSNPDLLEKVLDSLDAVKRGDKKIPLIRTEKKFSKTIIEKHPVKNNIEKSLIALAHRGLLAISCSDYQFTYRSFDNQKLTKDSSKKQVQLLLNEISAFEGQLRNCQRVIFHSLGKSNPSSSLPAIFALISFTETNLPRFASVQAQAFKEIENLYHSKKQHGQMDKLGKLSTKAGSLTREALSSHAAAYRMIVDLHKGTLTREANNLLQKADTKAFDAKIPNGKDVKFTDLKEMAEDKLIEFGGIVQSVDSSRERSGKLIGSAVLKEPASGETVQVAFPYAHLSHMGITKNSYCVVNGYYKASSKILSGNAGIEIQKFSIKELADQVWRFAFIRYADDWYECWRNQANMMFSMGPHIIEEDYAQTGTQGAGELIYPPYYRL